MEGVASVGIVDGDSVSFGSVKAGVVCNGGRAVKGIAISGRDGRRCRSGLVVGDSRFRELGREEVLCRCGLGLGEWSTILRCFLCGENGWVGRLGSAAPLLARCLVWLDITLEFVDCDQRCRLPTPSPFVIRSECSPATLCLRLDSCEAGLRPDRRAAVEGSLGLCALAGPAEARCPVVDELRDPVRWAVSTEAEESEFEREE